MYSDPYIEGDYDAQTSTVDMRLHFIVNFSYADKQKIQLISDPIEKEKQFKMVEALYHQSKRREVELLLSKIIKDIKGLHEIQDINLIFDLIQCSRQQLNMSEFYDTTVFSCILGINVNSVMNVQALKVIVNKIKILLNNKYGAEASML